MARECGRPRRRRFNTNKGLAVAFQAGIDAALKLGADVVVNTDADNQYQADDIPKLVQPILAHEADIVVGACNFKDHEEFSGSRSFCSAGARGRAAASQTDIPDVTSGFRAYNREAGLRLNVVSRFTYTIDTIIQAGKSGLAVTHVPIRTNPKMRESRLFRSNRQYVGRSIGTILRISVMYDPLPVFLLPAALVGFVGALLLGASPGSTSASRARQATYSRSSSAPRFHLRGAARPARRDQRPAPVEPHLRAHPAPRAQDRARRGRPARRGSQEALVGSGLSYGDDEA